MSRFLPLLLLLLAWGAARADVYRWVDEHGEPHYSDQWVPGSQVIKTNKARPGSETTSAVSSPITLSNSSALRSRSRISFTAILCAHLADSFARLHFVPPSACAAAPLSRL